MARPRVTIRTRDGTAWGYLDANELGTYNKDLVAKVGAAFGLGDTTIVLDDSYYSQELKDKMDKFIEAAATNIKHLDFDSKFMQQLLHAATTVRASIVKPDAKGKFPGRVKTALTTMSEALSAACSAASEFITCDNLALDLEKIIKLEMRATEQIARLEGRVAALEAGVTKFKEDLARVEKMASLSVAGTQACEARLSRFIDDNETRTQANEAQLDAGVASSKAQAKALAALHEQNVAGVARSVELERGVSKLRARHEELEAREEAFEREQALRDSELDTALEQQKLLTAELSKKLAELTSLKLREAKRQMERIEHLRNDFAMLKQGLDMVQWEQARTEDGGLQLFATNEDFLELKQAVADLAAAKEEEMSHAGGGATSDDPVDSFLAMAGTFLAAAEQQWAEPPPPTPEAGVTSLEVPEPLVEPIEGQEQLEVTTPPHPATLPPPIGLTVRPPPVEAGGQVDASPLPLSPPSNKKRGVLGQLSANLSRVFSPRRKPATPATPATPESDLAFYGFE